VLDPLDEASALTIVSVDHLQRAMSGYAIVSE